jgi:heat shock protein HtpX
VPRLFVSPAAQPNILTVGYSARSAAVCCTEGLLRLLTLAELRAVLAHELAHVARRDVAVSSWSAGLASLVASCPLIAVLLHITAPSGREYCADIDGALLTGDPMALASALRKIDTAATAQPLRPHGTLAAASHLMIAHPFPPDGVGGMLSTHPPTSERVRRLEALSGRPRLPARLIPASPAYPLQGGFVCPCESEELRLRRSIFLCLAFAAREFEPVRPTYSELRRHA